MILAHRVLLVTRRVLSALRDLPVLRDRLGLTGLLVLRGRRAQPALSLDLKATLVLLV